MPIYEYRCSECGNRFEKILPRSSSPAPRCPECGAKKPEKLISAPGSVGATTSTGPASCPASSTGGCPAGSGFG